MRKHVLSGLFAIAFASGAFAQTTFPQNGVHDQRMGLYAFTNVTIVVVV